MPERRQDAPAFAHSPSSPPPPAGRRSKSHRIWAAFEGLLWSIAAASTLYLGYVFADRALWSREAERELTAATAPATAAAIDAPSAPTRRPPFLARLEIPSLELTSLVVDGVDDVTLRRAVGRIPSSSRPGEPGNVALAGHRDTDFRALQHLKKGDRIDLATSEGRFGYEVDWIRIVAPERVDVLAPESTPTLTLVTCYPFHYIGRAPLRYVVRAREVSRPPLVVAGIGGGTATPER